MALHLQIWRMWVCRWGTIVQQLRVLAHRDVAACIYALLAAFIASVITHHKAPNGPPLHLDVPPCTSAAAVLCMPLCVHRRDVVRSVDCFDGAAARTLLCVTAGEDSQVALWTLDEATAAAAATVSSSKDSADSAGPRRHHSAAAVSSARRSPY